MIRTFTITLCDLDNVEVEAEWVPAEHISTDRGTQTVPGYWSAYKVGWCGVNLTPGIDHSDKEHGTDFWEDINDKIASEYEKQR